MLDGSQRTAGLTDFAFVVLTKRHLTKRHSSSAQADIQSFSIPRHYNSAAHAQPPHIMSAISVHSLRLGTVGAGNSRLKGGQPRTTLVQSKVRAAAGRGPALFLHWLFCACDAGRRGPAPVTSYFTASNETPSPCSRRHRLQGRPPQSSAAARRPPAHHAPAPSVQRPAEDGRPLRHGLPRFCRAARLAAAASTLRH